MQLLDAPLFVPTTNDGGEFEGRWLTGGKGVSKSLQSIDCEDCSVVVFASEWMGAHKRPVDSGRYASEESCEITLVQILEYSSNLLFSGILSVS